MSNTRYDPMLTAFSAAMMTQMTANDNRGGGSRGNIANNEPVPRDLFDELKANVEKLERVIYYDESATGQPEASLIEHRASIRETAADVANMAMLIALNSSALELKEPEIECTCGACDQADEKHDPTCPAR